MKNSSVKRMIRGGKVFWNLRKQVPIVFKLLNDDRVKKWHKMFYGIVTLGYFFFPYDFIFDLPFFGQLDDLAVFIFMTNWFFNRVPDQILEEYGWDPDDEK